MGLINCPACARQISAAATACPSCGHPIQATGPAIYYSTPPQPQWHPGIAAVLSLVIPGAGQMYKGAVGTGILWLIFVSIGYVCLVIPGLVLHLFCILGAASGDPNA